MTMDHVIPLVIGGPHHPDNIQPLCQRCNSRKGARVIDYRPGSPIFVKPETEGWERRRS